jgi:hypothetical protein
VYVYVSFGENRNAVVASVVVSDTVAFFVVSAGGHSALSARAQTCHDTPHTTNG